MEDVVDEVLDAPNSDDEEKGEAKLKEKNDEMFDNILSFKDQKLHQTTDDDTQTSIKGNDKISTPTNDLSNNTPSCEKPNNKLSQIVQHKKRKKLQNSKPPEIKEKNLDTSGTKTRQNGHVELAKEIAKKHLNKVNLVAIQKAKLPKKLSPKTQAKKTKTIHEASNEVSLNGKLLGVLFSKGIFYHCKSQRYVFNSLAIYHNIL